MYKYVNQFWNISKTKIQNLTILMEPLFTLLQFMVISGFVSWSWNNLLKIIVRKIREITMVWQHFTSLPFMVDWKYVSYSWMLSEISIQGQMKVILPFIWLHAMVMWKFVCWSCRVSEAKILETMLVKLHLLLPGKIINSKSVGYLRRFGTVWYNFCM